MRNISSKSKSKFKKEKKKHLLKCMPRIRAENWSNLRRCGIAWIRNASISSTSTKRCVRLHRNTCALKQAHLYTTILPPSFSTFDFPPFITSSSPFNILLLHHHHPPFSGILFQEYILHTFPFLWFFRSSGFLH